MIMNKIIGLAVLLFCLSGCVRDNDAIYYPVGNVDVERGGPALEAGKGDLIARSYNTEDYVLDTLAQYPGVTAPHNTKQTYWHNWKSYTKTMTL